MAFREDMENRIIVKEGKVWCSTTSGMMSERVDIILPNGMTVGVNFRDFEKTTFGCNNEVVVQVHKSCMTDMATDVEVTMFTESKVTKKKTGCKNSVWTDVKTTMEAR
tara:strand:+ start:12912 stop:13235 length:324 start_codon:yes stop_codon:yes gene_type:complete